MPLGLALLEQQEGMHQKQPQLYLNAEAFVWQQRCPASLTHTQVAVHPLWGCKD